MPRRSGPVRWPLVVLAVAFVGFGVIAIVSGNGSGDDDERAGAPDTPGGGRAVVVTTTTVPTEAVEGDPEPITPGREAYALTYRVEGITNDGGAVIDVERRSVRPLYASRVETVPADDEDAAPTFLQVSELGLLVTGREDEPRAALAAEPMVAPGEARLGVDLADALDAGLVEWRHEARTILERRCQVFRAGGPIDVATLEAAKDDTWADLCVADDGLVLQEEWVIGGSVFRRRTAVDLDDTPRFDVDTFEAAGEREASGATGVFAELTVDSRPPGVTYYEVVEPPAGFRHRGRYGYTPPRAQVDVGAAEPAKVAMVLDLFEDGEGGMLVVANGGSSDNSPTVVVGEGDRTVDLRPLGIAEVVLGLRQNELRIGFEHGRFLRLYGTVPTATLASVARALHPNDDPGGTVTAK